jgi:hypothetical protein
MALPAHSDYATPGAHNLLHIFVTSFDRTSAAPHAHNDATKQTREDDSKGCTVYGIDSTSLEVGTEERL